MAVPLPWLKPAVVAGGLLPSGLLLVQGLRGALGANVVERVLNQLGLLALLLLLLSLLCTPLKVLFKWTWPLRVRKQLGLLAFAYACLHFTVYVVLDQGFDGKVLFKDLTQRPFIVVGFGALLLLLPLALTSTNASVRRLGFPRWQRLHRLVYVAAALACLHFFLRVKADVREPLLYAGSLVVLLLIRAGESFRKARLKQRLPESSVR